MKALIIMTALGLGAWTLFAQAGDLVDSTYIDTPIAKVQAKHKLQDRVCEYRVAEQCKNKYGSECTCHQVVLTQTGKKNQTLFFVINAGTVVEYMDQKNTSENFYESFFPRVQEFSGDVKPFEVFADSGGKNHEAYGMHWKKNGVNYRVNALCPLEIYGGKRQMKTPLRKCLQYGLMASKFREFPTGEWNKIAAEY